MNILIPPVEIDKEFGVKYKVYLSIRKKIHLKSSEMK